MWSLLSRVFEQILQGRMIVSGAYSRGLEYRERNLRVYFILMSNSRRRGHDPDTTTPATGPDSGPDSAPLVSVLIPAYNHEKFVGAWHGIENSDVNLFRRFCPSRERLNQSVLAGDPSSIDIGAARSFIQANSPRPGQCPTLAGKKPALSLGGLYTAHRRKNKEPNCS